MIESHTMNKRQKKKNARPKKYKFRLEGKIRNYTVCYGKKTFIGDEIVWMPLSVPLIVYPKSLPTR